MSFRFQIFLIAILVIVILALQIKASLLILRDSLSEPSQRISQFLMVWLLPMIGAIVVMAVHRPLEKPSGKYRTPPDPGDDFGFSGRRTERPQGDGDGD